MLLLFTYVNCIWLATVLGLAFAVVACTSASLLPGVVTTKVCLATRTFKSIYMTEVLMLIIFKSKQSDFVGLRHSRSIRTVVSGIASFSEQTL